MSSLTEAFVKTGLVSKKSPKGMFGAHMWQKRWLVLSKETLYYFKEKTSKEAQGTIPVNKITGVYRVPSKKSPARFDVCHNNRAYAFKCEVSDDASKWVDAIFNLLPAQQKLKAKAEEAKLAKQAAAEEDDGSRKSVIGGGGGDEDEDESAAATPKGSDKPKSLATGGSASSLTPATPKGSDSKSSAATPKAGMSGQFSPATKDTKTDVVDEVKLENDEKKDAGAVQIRVRTQTGARVLMYASPAMRLGKIKEHVWSKKAFPKDKINDYAVKLFNGDMLFDDTQSFGRFQYLTWVFAEDKTTATAALPSVNGVAASAAGITDVYIVPKSDFVDITKPKGAAASSTASNPNKNKPTPYGLVVREGAISQLTAGTSTWKDRYAVQQDDVLLIFDTKAAWQNRITAASVYLPMGAVKAKNAADVDPSSSGAAAAASPKGSSAPAKPNTIELSGGPLKMDVIKFSVDSKEALDKWLDAFANAHLRLVKLIMVSCAEELENRGLGMEGLFRLSGSQDEVLKLKDDFDNRHVPSLKKSDDHALTGVFKLCLRKMFNPLIPFKHYDDFIHTAEVEAKSDQAAVLKGLIPKLPVANQNGLQYLMAFLLRVSTFHETNKMKPANLSIVIAPNILRPREETMQSTVGDAGNQLKTIALLIERHAEVWGKPITDTYNRYITQLIKHFAGDTKVDASDLIAWQKDYNTGASAFMRTVATSELGSVWNTVFGALEKTEYNITPEVHSAISQAISEEEAFRAATLERIKALAATLTALAPTIKAAPVIVKEKEPEPIKVAVDDPVDEPAPAAAESPTKATATATASTPKGSSTAAAAASTKPVEHCTALYDYNATEPGELTFKEGDRIRVNDRSDDWWKGTIVSSGASGQFPSNYVQLETTA